MVFMVIRIHASRCRRWLLRQLLLSSSMRSMTPIGEVSPLIEKDGVSATTRTAFALGHVYNDLAAAMWFSYTLLFLQRVALLEPVTAGSLLLLGQVVDALLTPVFGILVDKYPKRKTWHLIGSSMVLVAFPVLFGSFTQGSSPALTMFVYVVSIIVFQIGWAAVQISHLSMIPALTSSSLIRAELTAIRYSAQVGAAVVVFVVTWAVLPTTGAFGARLGPEDNFKFRNIVVVLTLFGATSTIMFHAFLNARLLEVHSPVKSGGLESNPLNISHSSSVSTHFNTSGRFFSAGEIRRSKRSTWFARGLLARVAMLYVASRLFITLATVYLPLYIEETDAADRQALATVPMVSYTTSFVTAFLLKYINRSCGSKICYMLGALIGLAAAATAEFAGSTQLVIYTVAILIGAGSSITMVTALSITAEFIGSRIESSALIYSVVTFLDKVITGLAVLGIEKWRCLDKDLCPHYNRDTLAWVCATSMALGLLTLTLVSRCISK